MSTQHHVNPPLAAADIPLVSCVMPTYNRRSFVPHAIRYFLRQDYANKELIIIDDGTDSIRDLVPDVVSIRYFRLEQRITLGAKLNLACGYAAGTIIANWDDDDWYAPNRLSYQVAALEGRAIDICGINNLLYYDLRKREAFNYVYPSDQRVWLLGSSQCYMREFWRRHRFAEINVGMDGIFVWKTTPGRVAVLGDNRFAVHMIHDANVSPKRTDTPWWHSFAVEEIAEIVGKDWECYSGFSVGRPSFAARAFSGAEAKMRVGVPVKNVYACLVHERPECIADLVSNLRYHDPDSAILLYNGGSDPGLLSGLPPGEGLFHVPDARPQRWGYLHPFALESMRYALDVLSFDTLTIVDSDQLGLRSGYCRFLGEYLASLSGVGLLSSMPERVRRSDVRVHPAIQAFREYDLWKPFLRNFENGENKFVHWTYWPSTVFTADATADLVRLFDTSTQLAGILERSRIWATEEIVLPTLVSLLGYAIAANPCSYAFVKYKKNFMLDELKAAMARDNAYWMHPVERKYDNPLRAFLRLECGEYLPVSQPGLSAASPALLAGTPPAAVPTGAAASCGLLPPMRTLLARIRVIQGWLSDAEAGVLIELTRELCLSGTRLFAERGAPDIVEIGSYHGKSTVLFGTILKALAPGGKIHAIDPHDGKQGAVDRGLQTFPPSYEHFRRNLLQAGVTDNVVVLRNSVAQVRWERPIQVLFVDGLHDYAHVSADFRHFSDWIVPGGWAVFHDYADYFPGVRSFVDGLLAEGAYRRYGQAESLVVLQKS